jgi:hypothetical protein
MRVVVAGAGFAGLLADEDGDRDGIMGQLIRHSQQPVTGMLDQLRQHVVQMHATTSGLP